MYILPNSEHFCILHVVRASLHIQACRTNARRKAPSSLSQRFSEGTQPSKRHRRLYHNYIKIISDLHLQP